MNLKSLPKQLINIALKYHLFIMVAMLLVGPNTITLAQDTPLSIRTMSWNSDGSKVAVGYGTGRCDSSHPEYYGIKIFNAAMTQVLQSLTGSQCDVTSIDWNLDGSKIAAASIETYGVHVWDVQTGLLLATAQTGGQGYIDINWQPPNYRYLAVTSVGNSISIIDSTTGESIGPAPIGGTRIDWNTNGTKLVSVSSYQNAVYVADMVLGQQILALNGHNEGLDTVDWSPDGTKLASGGGFTSDYSIRIWDAITGTNLITLSGHTATVTEVSWSPDSHFLASASGDGTVRIWDITTGAVLAVFNYAGVVLTVDWKPTGDYIVFGGARSDGQNATPDMEFVGLAESFALLAANNSIIADPLNNAAEFSLSSLPSSVKFRAYTNPETSGSVKFELSGSATASFTDDTQPYEMAWTPTAGSYTLTATPYSGAGGTGTAGTPLTINFTVSNNLNRILFRHNNHIYIMNADGTNPVDLGAGESPSFSPNGSRIAFQLNGTGGREIWTMNADGTGRLRLTNNNIDDRNPSWSPDGSRIVYCSVITGADWELWIMNADGTSKVQITNNTTDDADPAWSTNNVIVFSALTGGYRQIFTMWPDGTHRTLLTSGNSDKMGPEWSPDGSMIVYNTAGGTNDDIRRINADGTNALRLTNDASSDIDGEWSQDGSKIIFSSTRAGGTNHELYIMNIDGSAETRFTVTSLDEIQPAWGYP